MPQPSPIRAVAAYLRATAGVSALASTRVFIEELPQDENVQMPRAVVVISSAGGGLMGHAQKFGDRRIDVLCYGATPAKSRELHDEVRAALKLLLREKISDTNTTSVLLHWARISADGTTARDPDTDWPVTGSSWQVLASDIPA